MADLRDRIPNISKLVLELDRDYSHIHSILKGTGTCGAALAVNIEHATGGAIKRWELRPDLWDPPANPVPENPAPHSGSLQKSA